MIIKKMALPRRTVLRGIGASVALPFLDAMVPALAARTAAKPPTRLGFVYFPNGIILRDFLPQSEGKDFEISRILTPLGQYRDHVTVISGLANAAGDPLDSASGPHSRASGSYLSGTRARRSETDILSGITVDQHAAKRLGEVTPLASLELALESNSMTGNCEGGFGCVYINTLSWRTPRMPLPMETNPRVVFERMFGERGDTASRVGQLRMDRSILDSVTGDLSRLQQTLGATDRRTLGDYLDAVREVEHTIEQTEKRAASWPTLPGGPLGIPGEFKEHAEVMFDLMFLAYQADITRVVTFQIGRELGLRSYPELGVAEAHHEISHHGNRPADVEKCIKINVFHMELYSRLVAKMAATADGDGSLLDHAMMLCGAAFSDSNVHNCHNLPVMVVGRGSGQLPGGRHVKAKFDTPLMNLGLTLLDKVGIEVESIGNSTGRLTDI